MLNRILLIALFAIADLDGSLKPKLGCLFLSAQVMNKWVVL